MKKKRILFVMHTMIGRGAEKVLLNILKNIDETKFEVDLFLILKTGVHINDIPNWIKVNYLFLGDEFFENRNPLYKNLYKLYRKVFLRIYMKFPKLIYRFKIDNLYDTEVAFLQWYTNHVVANSPLDTKKIGWVHIDLSQTTTGAYCYKKDFEKLDQIVFVSRDAEKGFINKFPDLSHKNRSVIYNMLDINKIISNSLKPVDIEKKKFTLISVGSLTKQKRFDRLLKAHKCLLGEGFDLDVWIVGIGSEEKNLKRLVCELGTESNVKFLGYQTNPYKFIRNADIYVMSSDYEGFSLVVGEAIVLGKPVVSTDCAGPTELLNNGEYGLVVDRDEKALADGIKKMINDKNLKEKFEGKTQSRKDIFDIESIIKKIENIV